MFHFWLVLHLLGYAVWMGAGFASMVSGVRGRRESRAVQGAVTRLQAALHQRLIGPAAIITLLSGIFLTARVMGADAAPPSSWLMVMQVAGLAAALLVVFVSWPTSNRLAKIDPEGPLAELFNAMRRRQAIAGSIAGTLGLVALLGGAMLR